ncbi:RNA-directed DNA polymerase, eukaryota, Reverse transcriptase zinc-binding domain protein [Artemisia annua]|uniref:RNA-directed DNA polymerase, eukaryota, Reverse transcriptase zinc-binding domain protein n=1 Tax=Artemisia annua TaxID=35608 RepID=A0A2U1KAU1_ARTAN|nr:RNA-directed DNA polymerase, eukaryota, Reverse transcriptase zinc-binding domain protein [Artemisia annua]
MANLAFTDAFIGAHAIFQPYRISDHSPAILTIPTSHKFTPRPFKFYNIIVQNSQFKGKVKEFWDMDVSGFHMYKVVSKLKSLKKPLLKDNQATSIRSPYRSQRRHVRTNSQDPSMNGNNHAADLQHTRHETPTQNIGSMQHS